jgi:hypothetical protein
MLFQDISIRSSTSSSHLCPALLNGLFSGTVLGYGPDDQGFESQQRLEILLFTTASRPALGPTQPPTKEVPGALFWGVKQLRHEADHSPPSNAKVKNVWSYTSTPPIHIHGMVFS